MKTPLLLASFGIAAITCAQEPPPSTSSQWSLQAMGTAAITYRTLIDKEGSTTSGVIIDLRDDMEEPRPGFGGQVMLMRRLGAHWALGVGLCFLRFGYQSHFDMSDLSFGDVIDPRRGFVYSTSSDDVPVSIRYVDDFQYIGIPVLVQRSWGSERWHPTIGLSLTPSYIVRACSTGYYSYPDGVTEEHLTNALSDFENINLFAALEAGCAYDASERLQLRVLPYASMGLLEVSDTPVSARLWSIGVQAGVARRL